MAEGCEATTSINELLAVMRQLRDPQSGCPWDIAQDFSSIVASTLEECYELAETIEREDYPHLEEELGDLLFQVVFYAQLGAEQKLFDFDSVTKGIITKLIRRHPHVFESLEANSAGAGKPQSVEDVGQRWESIKQEERRSKGLSSTLSDIPLALPALSRAQKVQKRAARVGFDWPDVAAAAEKIREEFDEMQEAIATKDQNAVAEELGDLLFSCVNVARHLDLDAETTLRQATRKFEHRYTLMEALITKEGEDIASLSDEQLNLAWEQAKRLHSLKQ